jgi:hypothetical protein
LSYFQRRAGRGSGERRFIPMKDLLCQAFCASLKVRAVPVGYAVETPYTNADADPLLLYYVRDGLGKKFRIEDDGTQVPFLEANGVDLKGQARGEAFQYLLTEYGSYYDAEARVIHTTYLPESELGEASIKFVALLLRLQDLALLSPHVVRSTFREDVITAIRGAFGSTATVEESAPVSSELAAYHADCVITAPNRVPLAVYLGLTEERALQALVLKMELEKYRSQNSRVVLILEKAKDNPLRESTYALSQARLDKVLSFRGVEADSMATLQKNFHQSITIQ